MAANKRMFSNDIVSSDFFLDMPTSTQALYFQLGMQADDRGFVQPKKIMRMLGSAENEVQLLLAKKFLLSFEDGVVLIKHWRMNNNKIDSDRFKETTYREHLLKVYEKENKGYTLNKDKGKLVCAQNVHSSGTQSRVEESRVDTLETLNTKIPDVDLKTKKKDMTWNQYKEPEIQLDEDYSPPQEEKSKKTWTDVDKKMWADKKNSLGLHGEIFMEYVIVKGLNFPTRASADACWYEFKKPAEEIASSYPYKEKVFEAIVKAQAERKPEMWNLRSIIKIMPTL